VKVGLVFGGGGILGGAWMIGGLHALVKEARWDLRQAELAVGTSAGSVIAAVGVAGRTNYFQLPVSPEEGWEALGAGVQRMVDDLLDSTQLRRSPAAKRRIPGSPALFWTGIRRQAARPVVTALTGLLPSGRASTQHIQTVVRSALPDGWPHRPRLWVTATDYDSGRRVTFGREGEPSAELALAVAASCAVPGLYEPVSIDGRVYVDGGIESVSNLDLVAGLGLEVVICLNPLSARERGGVLSPLARWQRHNHHILLEEAEVLRRQGTRVLLIEPTDEDLSVRGTNLMDPAPSDDVRRLAERTVAAQLHEMRLGELLGPTGGRERLAEAG
jgi:NTE family protein